MLKHTFIWNISLLAETNLSRLILPEGKMSREIRLWNVPSKITRILSSYLLLLYAYRQEKNKLPKQRGGSLFI